MQYTVLPPTRCNEHESREEGEFVARQVECHDAYREIEEQLDEVLAEQEAGLQLVTRHRAPARHRQVHDVCSAIYEPRMNHAGHLVEKR